MARSQSVRARCCVVRVVVRAVPGLLAGALVLGAGDARAATPPPRNPFLVDGISAMPHFDPSASDATTVPGPTGDVSLTPAQIRRLPGGVGNGVYVSAPFYGHDVEVIWTVNSGRVAKIRVDGGRFDELATHPLLPEGHVGRAAAEDLTRALDAAPTEDALTTIVRERHPYWLERIAVRAGIYPMMDRDGSLYVARRDEILVFGDARPGDPGSPIALRRRWRIPAEILSDWAIRKHALVRWWQGRLPERPADASPSVGQILEILRDTSLGLGMTWDGHVVVTTVSGGVAVVDREFARPAHTAWLGETVTNSSAIDEHGGIYVASDARLHKLVWTGERLSQDAGDGAWSAAYDVAEDGLSGIRAGSQGTGSTPTLMGFAPDEDHLVVLTDGAPRMKLVAFWRDRVPDGFVPRPGARSKRIADQRVVDFGIPDQALAQSEQSVAVWGYGALVVNNAGPDTLGSAFENVVAIGVTRPGPKGVAKLVWDPDADRWRDAWARADVGSPSTVPLVSAGSGQAYVQDARDGRFPVVGLDWETGATRTIVEFPRSQAFNGAYTQIQLLPSGDLFMGMLTGPVRTVLLPAPGGLPESR